MQQNEQREVLSYSTSAISFPCLQEESNMLNIAKHLHSERDNDVYCWCTGGAKWFLWNERNCV